jgi:hypothetical protein
MDGLLEILNKKVKIVFGKKTIIISLLFTIKKKRTKENKKEKNKKENQIFL